MIDVKKKIAIISFNIFAAGGTTRSNLNLISEFRNHGDTVAVYNFRTFTAVDVLTLKYQNAVIDEQVRFYSFTDLGTALTADYIFITRENFFPLAKYLRYQNPNSVIIGEIHMALPLVQATVQPEDLVYFSSIRVATESIRTAFVQRFNFKNVYVQTVSLAHLQGIVQTPFFESKADAKNQINFLVRTRFENEKDIPFAIQLMDYLVHYLQRQNFQFYIEGYGPGEILYRNLISYYNLKAYVFINQTPPENYCYLYTGRAESFGYSFAEAFDAGHPVIFYRGDDGVIFENFQAFKNCLWLQKDIVTDARRILDFVATANTLTDYQTNLLILKRLGGQYYERFLENMRLQSNASPKVPKKAVAFTAIYDALLTTDATDLWAPYRKIYNRLKAWPLIGGLLKQPKLKQWAILHLTQHLQNKQLVAADLPLTATAIFVESFHGQNFSGDPKYLALAIHQQWPQAEIFVSATNQLVDMTISRYGFVPIRTGTPDYIQKARSCKYVIINGNSLDKIGKRRGQIFIQTWHGLPLKHMVHDLSDPVQRQKEVTAFGPRMQKWDYLLTSSMYNTELLESAFNLTKNKHLTILAAGTPKNDYLLKYKNDLNEKKRLYLKYFNRPYDATKKIILYCPTWRQNNWGEKTTPNLKQLIHQLPPNYELIVKLHPLESSQRKHYKALDPRIYCFYNEWVDIQELYLLADILISDYSSAIFDYALLDKKIIITQDDQSKYEQAIGWYFDIKQQCGLTTTTNTVPALVTEILKKTPMTYDALIQRKLLTNETATASHKILQTIFAKDYMRTGDNLRKVR